MLVKICGLSNFIDAKAAVDVGADALGFVMGGKVLPVEVEPLAQHVRQWIHALPKTVDTYIVTHLMEVEEMFALSEYVNSSGIQVSETLTPGTLRKLREKTKKKIIKTIPVHGPDPLDYLRAVEPFCDFLLLDSVADGYIGGTGKPNDWELCATLIRAATKPVYIAGGLTPETVEAVIATTAPQGVDVSTGVSTHSSEYLKKDRKCACSIKQFIERAKRGAI